MSLIWRTTVTKDVEMRKGTEENVKFYMYPFNSVSLGNYRFIKKGSSELTYRHENGHSRQSIWLGIFYLIIIGLPSCVGNLIFRIPAVKNKFNYFHQPWERHSDWCAGIKR